MEEERWTPITGTFPDEKTILCKDCRFRDKTEVDLFGKLMKVGITRDTCDKYTGYNTPDGTGYKPHDVLFNNADCLYYEKDNAADNN